MIIVAGCSWSDAKWRCKSDETYDTKFPKWFDQLNTNKEVKSIGLSGSGNVYMFESLVHEIIANPKITHVVWGLSDWLRFNIFGTRINPQLSFAYKAQQDPGYRGAKLWKDQVMYARHQDSICKMSNWIEPDMIEHCIRSNLSAIHALAEMCNNRNIKLSIFQMLRPATVNARFDFKFNNHLYTHDLFASLEEKEELDVIGWPWINDIGGTNVDRWVFKNEPYFKAWRVSDVDAHPNERGHEAIAGWVNENITFD